MALEAVVIVKSLDTLAVLLKAGMNFMDAANKIDAAILASREPGGNLDAALEAIKAEAATSREAFEESEPL